MVYYSQHICTGLRLFWDDFPKKKIPSETWTHPPTSIAFLDFWGKKILCTAPYLKVETPLEEFSNYRRISLLPKFSKILEKMYHSRLMAFIDSNQIVYKSQYGFRKQMSTSLATIELVEDITNSRDNDESKVGVFIDLKKAFDTVDHSILIEKLYQYCIRGIASTWICSYLMNIYQYYVTLNGTNSDCINVLCGFSQGSILELIIFIFYINDMSSVSTLLKPILFEYDTNVFYFGKCIDELCSVVSI